MGLQSSTIERNENENKILDLEKKYFNIIKNIILCDDFYNDIKLIEKEISDNYTKFDTLWNLKNKIKVPAERVVRHHLYTKMSDRIVGIFPSPLSSDFGIKTNDAVVCVDIKTIDTKGNPGDLRSTCVEKNQNSFDNRNYPSVKVGANMNAIEDYSRLPVLTYIVKIVYHDDGVAFNLSRTDYPTIVITCIPNGKLSKLFEYNIVDNVKAYEYYSERNDGVYYTPIPLTSEQANSQDYMDSVCSSKGLIKFTIANLNNKIAYYDSTKSIIWWKTSFNNKSVIAPLKGASSTRYKNEILKNRYDSENNAWEGYIEYTILDSLINKGSSI